MAWTLDLSRSMAMTSLPSSYKALAAKKPKLPSPMTANFFILLLSSDHHILFRPFNSVGGACADNDIGKRQHAHPADDHHDDDHGFSPHAELRCRTHG